MGTYIQKKIKTEAKTSQRIENSQKKCKPVQTCPITIQAESITIHSTNVGIISVLGIFFSVLFLLFCFVFGHGLALQPRLALTLRLQ